MSSNANTAGLTEGPKGSIGLRGEVEPGGNQAVTSKGTGASHMTVSDGGPTEIMPKHVGSGAEGFTRPGNGTEVK